MLKTFATSESGAVTVEWVVLTAASVGMSLAVMGVISDGIEQASTDISTKMTRHGVPTSFQDFHAIYGRGDWAGLMSGGEAQAYQPYDQAAYDDFLARLRDLDDDQLAIADTGITQGGRDAVAAVTDAGGTVGADDQGGLNDREAALALVTHERGLVRTPNGNYSDSEFESTSNAMGFDTLAATGG